MQGLAGDVLLTDQYQLTMGQVYFREGLHEHRARFEHFFRSNPDYGGHQAGYAITGRDEDVHRLVDRGQVRPPGDREIGIPSIRRRWPAVLRATISSGSAENGDFESLSISAIPEGRVVHPGVPLTIVEGPLILAQLIETALLNHLNFETLIATKASRIWEAARGGTVLEFGTRRAQGSGAHSVVRAALIGGAAGSSLVGRSYELGFIPVGTHAHSIVQAFMALGMGELGAFRAYAEVFPDDCLLLVDTIDTLDSGLPECDHRVRRAPRNEVTARWGSGSTPGTSPIWRSARPSSSTGPDSRTRRSCCPRSWTRSPSGRSSSRSSRRLRATGSTGIRGQDDLSMGSGPVLPPRRATPTSTGSTSSPPSGTEGEWKPAIKVSDTPAKVMTPGAKRSWRIYDQRGIATADLLALDSETPHPPLELHHVSQIGVVGGSGRAGQRVEELAERVSTSDRPHPTMRSCRPSKRRLADLERLDPGVRRLVNPHVYHVSLTPELAKLKHEMISRHSV